MIPKNSFLHHTVSQSSRNPYTDRRYLIFYDGDCPVCIQAKNFVEKLNGLEVFFVNMRDLELLSLFSGNQGYFFDLCEMDKAVHALDENGKLRIGVEVVCDLLSRLFPGIGFLFQNTFLQKIMGFFYGFLAKYRYTLAFRGSASFCKCNR